MKTTKILKIGLILILTFPLFNGTEATSRVRSIDSNLCMSVTPGVLTFGQLRGVPTEQILEITSAGTWGAYVSASWIKINGSGTISSGGNGSITVTTSGPIPAGQPYFCGTKTTGYIYFYGCTSVQVEVNYVYCPCC